MKKLLAFMAVIFSLSLTAPLFALSYDNNEYQRKSRAYSELAAKAYDEGEYEAAVDYAKKAEENAALSVAFIEKMIARSDSQKLLFEAHTRLTWATELKADKYFPEPYISAGDAVAAADELFAREDYADANVESQKALDALSVVRKIIPLPATWRVKKWNGAKDCFWNIAKDPAIYGDPLLWKELYKANKPDLKQPSNPDLIMPDMIMVIPSLKGEYREGEYDPSITYESFKSQIAK